MEEKVNVIKMGTPIITKMGKIKAFVSGVCIRDQNISYEIVYFSDGSRENEWIYRFEFDVDETQPKTAGFNYNNEHKFLNQ